MGEVAGWSVGESVRVFVDASFGGRVYLDAEVKAVDEEAAFVAVEIEGAFEHDEGNTWLFPMRGVILDDSGSDPPLFDWDDADSPCGVEAA